MTMLRALFRRPAAAAALLALAGCGGAASGDPLPPGRYQYQASHPVPTGADSIHLSGVLVVGGASEEAPGHWDVPQLHPELRVLQAEDGALVLSAQPTYFGTIQHRISGAGGSLRCSGEYTWIADGGEERSLPVACSLAPGAPAGAGTAAPAPSPAVRPAAPDSAPAPAAASAAAPAPPDTAS